MNSGEMERLAKMAAHETVKETFLMLGMNVSTPDGVLSVQNQFATLRSLHYSMRHVRNVVIAGVLGAMVSGGVWAFWVGFKASAAAPAPTISAPGGSR